MLKQESFDVKCDFPECQNMHTIYVDTDEGKRYCKEHYLDILMDKIKICKD